MWSWVGYVHSLARWFIWKSVLVLGVARRDGRVHDLNDLRTINISSSAFSCVL